MRVDVWDLPGPRSFLRSVTDRIVSGSNIVLLWPTCAPRGFAEAFRAAQLPGRAICEAFGDSDEMPIDAVYRAALGEIPGDSAKTAKALARDEQVHGLVIHIPRVDVSMIGEWNRFIVEYSEAIRSVTPGERMAIVIEFSGVQTKAVPRKDVALDVIKWDDWANEGDAFILASSIMRSRTTTPKRRTFIAASVARLANWDFELAEVMCTADESAIASPRTFLSNWAHTLGWVPTTDVGWEHGTLHTVDGVATIHSAFLAISDPDALDRRTWSAQAGIYLPWIEERRIELLPRLNGYIRFPLLTDAGQVDRIQDLGIGQIAWAVRDSRIDPSTKKTIGRLREARNRLAHLQPLPPELALHDDLIG